DEVTGQNINPDTYVPKTLAKEISRCGRLGFNECLDLGLALSRALDELHRQNLVHRDIKPSNIIFVNGVPKLADIGLVADADEARSFVGTAGFIPPEGPGAPQADIYSLGKVLYECSTGKDRQEFPELPTFLYAMPESTRLVELNEVILKACKANPAERYQTAAEMRADLIVLAHGDSVQRLRTLEQRWAKLQKAGGVAALVIGIAAVISIQGYREWMHGVESTQRQVGANVALGTRAAESSDRLSALTHFAAAVSLDQGDVERERMHRLRFGSALDQCPKLVQMWFFDREINDVRFNPRGRNFLVTEWNGEARLVDFATEAPLVLAGAQRLARAAYNPDGSFVATASEDQTVRVYATGDGQCLLTLNHPDKALCAEFSPDGSRIVTGCKDGHIRVWDARTGEVVLLLQGHSQAVLFTRFSPDGQLIASASRDNTARLWSVATGAALRPPLQHPTWVDYVAFHPDSRTLVTACLDHKARVWDVATGKKLLADLKHNDGISSAEFSPDGRSILTASFDGTARIWTLENPKPDSNLILRHGARVTCASFAPDGHRLLTAGADGSVRLWDLAGTLVMPVNVRKFASPDGKLFLTVSNDSFQVRDMLSGNPLSPATGTGRAIDRAEFSGNGKFVLSLHPAQPDRPERSLRIWDARTGKARGSGIPLPAGVTNFVLSPGGECLAGIGEAIVRLWDVARGPALSAALTHEAAVRCVSFSPDGQRLASASDRTVQIWNARTGLALVPPLVHDTAVSHVAFNADGSLLAVSTADDQFNHCFAQIWNTATGKPVGRPLQHSDGVIRAEFSPDGARIATASEDFTAKLWDPLTGRHMGAPLRHAHQVLAAVFSPDNQWILTTSNDKSARLWNVETGEPITPPLPYPTPFVDAAFDPQQTAIITFERTREARVWNLPVDRRPVGDLMLLAKLMSGDGTTSRSAWLQLRQKYGADFSVSPAEIAAWHEAEAQASESQGQWSAALFHWERVVEHGTHDSSVLTRLAAARANARTTD
ncbi:MAG TPA: protein kinase, partial [Clostridia bacterium]|nr:protein kinase [Clostridia bacterium]